MRKIVLLVLVICQSLVAQKQDISLEDIWTKNTFSTEKMEAFHSMSNGDYYSILKHDKQGTTLNKYDYATLQKTQTIVSTDDLGGITFFDNYTFSEDESKLIIGINREKIYRHSWLGKYFVYSLERKKLELIYDKSIQEPTFSPDGEKVSFVFENNLYIKILKSGEIIQITSDGENNKIINGVTDWVYEEEFSFVRAFQWNGDSDKIAFIRFDETKVPEFSMDIYGEDLCIWHSLFDQPGPQALPDAAFYHKFGLFLFEHEPGRK